MERFVSSVFSKETPLWKQKNKSLCKLHGYVESYKTFSNRLIRRDEAAEVFYIFTPDKISLYCQIALWIEVLF